MKKITIAIAAFMFVGTGLSFAQNNTKTAPKTETAKPAETKKESKDKTAKTHKAHKETKTETKPAAAPAK